MTAHHSPGHTATVRLYRLMARARPARVLAEAITSLFGRSRDRRALRAPLNACRDAALLYVAAKLGLADLLADGPRSSAELAGSLGAHAPSLHRILRALVALGVCLEEPDGRFGLTGLGAWLRAGNPRSICCAAIMSGEEQAQAYGGLLHSAMTGETAFDHVFGMSNWAHRQQHPELGACFDDMLERSTEGAAGVILASYDFSSFRTVADIGGGRGALLAAILRAHPSVNGILFDQPHVVAGARAHLEAAGVAERCRFAGGSFFDRVPEGADAYVLKSLIHDWDDERSRAILANCHEVLKDGGKLLLIERILPARVSHDPGTVWSDLQMMVLTGGRERTEAEYRALLACAGFTLTRIIPTRSRFNVIEAVRGNPGGSR